MSYYEINVSRDTGSAQSPRFVHFFATAERSITNETELHKVYDALKLAFPLPEFLITVTRWETTGRQINMTKGT